MLQIKAWLNDGKDVRLGDWKAADVEILNSFQLLTAKPVVYLVTYFAHLVYAMQCISSLNELRAFVLNFMNLYFYY